MENVQHAQIEDNRGMQLGATLCHCITGKGGGGREKREGRHTPI